MLYVTTQPTILHSDLDLTRYFQSSMLHRGTQYNGPCTRREFFREILYNNIAIIAIQHNKIYIVDTFGDFSHTVE